MRKDSVLKYLAWVFLFSLVLTTCLPSRVSAQVVKGSISGTVIDPTGGAIPDAEVVAVSGATGAAYKTKTETSGLFKLPLLAVGKYTLTVTKEGFNKFLLNNVEVMAGQDNGLGMVRLEIGQISTTVEVSAAPGMIQTTQSQISNSVTSSMLTVFPGLDFNVGLDSLALMVPGVVDNRDVGFSNTNGASFSVNGIRGRNNDQQIDGANNNDNSVAGPGFFLGNTDFVQEYQIVTNNFGPEYGRNAGSVVNIITKSGTNDWHGDVFVTEGNNKLNALSNTQKAFQELHKLPPGNDEFSGGSAGGPIVKDKVFVFGGFDNEIIPRSSVFSSGNLTPTPLGLQQLQACFPNSTSLQALASYGPFGVTGGNPVISGTPRTRTATVGDVSCDFEASGVKRTLNTSRHIYDVMGRLDVNTDKNRFYGRFLWQKDTPLNAPGYANGAAGYPSNVPSMGQQWGFSWTRNLSSSMFNEARLNFGRLGVQFGGNGIGNTLPQMSNLAGGLGSVTMPSGYLNWGVPNTYPQGRIVNTYQFQDNWSYLRGRHQLKAGANLTYQRSPNVFLPNYNGTWSFANFNNFIANIPSSIAITLGDPNLDFREHDSFFYFGDDFKVRQNLTLNLGVTYTYFGQPANLFHNADLKRESGPNPFFNPELPLSVRTFPKMPAPKNSVGPSIGFAYSPEWGGAGKTVLRGGYRLAFDPPFYNIYTNMASSAPQVLSQTLTPVAGGPPLPPLLAQPSGPANRTELASDLTLGVMDPRSFSQTSLAPDFRADHVQSWSFGIQRQLGPSVVFESRYVGNHGGALFQTINGNPYVAGLASLFPNAMPSGVAPCSSADAAVGTAVGRVNCNMGVIRIRGNTASSDYHGWQSEIRTTNLWNQLTLRSAFTWSKTTDNASEIYGSYYGGGTLALSQNPFNYKSAEHGLSALDIPKNWTLAFSEQVPFFKSQQGVVGHILGGWSFSGSYMIASGQPYGPVQQYLAYSMYYPGPFPFDTTFNSFVNSAVSYENLRPFMGNPNAPVSLVGIYAGDLCAYDGAAGCNLSPNTVLSFNAYNNYYMTGEGTPQYVIGPNGARFIVNGPTAQSIYGTPYGNVGRNILRDAITNRANFALYKYIKVTERLKVRFDTTFFNVFNHPNFYSVDPYLDDAGVLQEEYGFGIPSLYDGGGRVITFGLRVEF